MGGGDLNMKKSWHPLLLKNQERVWLEEKKALEEKKKLDQLRKEKEEERQLQELQRMQEEQTGKKRQDKLDWMYATPATGSNQNPNDLEDYLLGKKRVDKILTADENEKIGAAHKNFIATQYANNMRDTAAKIREDPLLAIKQQEQATYQALMSNPLRLREVQERNGIKPKKTKKDKEKEKHKHRKNKHKAEPRSHSPDDDRDGRGSESRDRYVRRRSLSPYSRRSRSPVPSRSRYDDDRRDDYRSSRRGRSQSRSVERYHDSRRRSPIPGRTRTWPRSDESDDNGYSSRRPRSRSPDRHENDVDNRKRRRSPSPPRADPAASKRTRTSPRPRDAPPPSNDRAARLAAMSSNASSLTTERREYLATRLAQEKAELEAEDRLRARSKGMGGFLSHEQKKVFSGAGGIEERIRRGRGQMRVDGD